MRLAIVTGGSKGLGSEVCARYAGDGWKVVEFSRSAPLPHSVQADLSRPIEARRAFDLALGEIDPRGIEEIVAIHNAGLLDPMGPVDAKSPESVVANLSVNLAGGILFFASVIGHFHASPGRKVLASVSSGAALRTFSGWSLYGAAKAGLDHFVRHLALEQGSQPFPFTAINIDPGVIDTGMQAGIRAADPADFPDVARFVQRKEKGQLVDPRRVARAVVRILARQDLVGGERYATNDHLD